MSDVRTTDDMRAEIVSLRKEMHCLNAQLAAAREAINAERALSTDKYSAGFVAGANDAAIRISQAITQAREDFR